MPTTCTQRRVFTLAVLNAVRVIVHTLTIARHGMLECNFQILSNLDIIMSNHRLAFITCMQGAETIQSALMEKINSFDAHPVDRHDIVDTISGGATCDLHFLRPTHAPTVAT